MKNGKTNANRRKEVPIMSIRSNRGNRREMRGGGSRDELVMQVGFLFKLGARGGAFPLFLIGHPRLFACAL